MSTQQQRQIEYNQLLEKLKTLASAFDEKSKIEEQPDRVPLSKMLEDKDWNFPLYDANANKKVEEHCGNVQTKMIENIQHAIDQLTKVFNKEIPANNPNANKILHIMASMVLETSNGLVRISQDTFTTQLKTCSLLDEKVQQSNQKAIEASNIQDAELQKYIEMLWQQQGIYKDSKTAENDLTRQKLNQLMAILNHYEKTFNKNPKTAKLDQDKLNCIQSLKNILLTEKNYKERANEFLVEVERISKLPTMKLHSTPLWQRLIQDLLSCLLVLPALYRAVQCNKRFNRFSIFKADSENLLSRLDEVAKAPLGKYQLRGV